ncbi:hypothetical protein [Flavobacterium sp. LB3P122]|uniref:hypothetical protein n=1 Tax=Flavobacterium algoriphilum TaxID=3398738 RepID=UPI003A8B24C3
MVCELTFVAIGDNGEILGTYIIKPNQIDLGDHIANCAFKATQSLVNSIDSV